MTEEPTYTYIRGKGWVPFTEPEYHLAYDRLGKPVRMYFRKPNPGERLILIHKSLSDSWWDSERDQPNYEVVRNHIKVWQFEDFSPFEVNGIYDKMSDTAAHITLIADD